MASNSRPRSGSSGSNRAQGRNNPRKRARARPRRLRVRRICAEGRTGAPSSRRAPVARPSSASARTRSSQVTPRQSVTSVRIGDMDRMERAEHARQARKRRGPLIVLGVLAALASAAVDSLRRLALVRLRHQDVDFVGADHLTKNRSPSSCPSHRAPRCSTSTSTASELALACDSWVQSVTVNRIFPSTLEIVVSRGGGSSGAIVEDTHGGDPDRLFKAGP